MSFSFSFVANKKIFHFTSKLVSISTSREVFTPEKNQKKEKTRYRFLRSYERLIKWLNSKQSLHSFAHYRCYARKYFVGKRK